MNHGSEACWSCVGTCIILLDFLLDFAGTCIILSHSSVGACVIFVDFLLDLVVICIVLSDCPVGLLLEPVFVGVFCILLEFWMAESSGEAGLGTRYPRSQTKKAGSHEEFSYLESGFLAESVETFIYLS